MEEIIKLPMSGKMGHWRIGDPNGVVCPFCWKWQNLPTEKCKHCGANLLVRKDVRKC